MRTGSSAPHWEGIFYTQAVLGSFADILFTPVRQVDKKINLK